MLYIIIIMEISIHLRGHSKQCNELNVTLQRPPILHLVLAFSNSLDIIQFYNTVNNITLSDVYVNTIELLL